MELVSAGARLTEGMLRKCMLNRELSWLQFNERVLEEADDPENPLFERFFFLSIFSSNLDEFYMIRVGALRDHVINKTGVIDNKTGMDAAAQLALVYGATERLYVNRDIVCQKLESELSREGVVRLNPLYGAFEKRYRRLADSFFDNQIKPRLAPQIIDASHPFPHLENNRQLIALSLEAKGGKTVFGIIPLPGGVERMYFPADGRYILAEDIILEHCDAIFKHYKLSERAIIRVTRNADIVAEAERFDEDEDFRDHMTKLLKKRKRLAPVRLEIRGANCGKLAAYLQKRLSLTPAQTFYSTSPLDMSHYLSLGGKLEPRFHARHSYAPFDPVNPAYASSYAETLRRVRSGDLLLSHPYEGIQPLFTLLRGAAEDRHTQSIQITLYRVDRQSKLVDLLITAAENGKDVFVFIELRARMDEENNIVWARRLEEAGCKVFYGPESYKLHAKICLVTRRDGMRQEYITHIGTGNYNEGTARLYTDVSIITARGPIGADASLFFNNLMLGLHDVNANYGFICVSPQGFKQQLIGLIEKEAALGERGLIIIKCNSLTDRDVIAALAGASCAGASVRLIVRGICCLKARIPGLTENIRVRSVVGRFLEHARIYRFGAGEGCVIYVGSGDMMTRNTERRVELFMPVLDAAIKKRLCAMLDVVLRDNVKAREMGEDGLYSRVSAQPGANAQPYDKNVSAGGDRLESQAYFLREAAAASGSVSARNIINRGPVFSLLTNISSFIKRRRAQERSQT